MKYNKNSEIILIGAGPANMFAAIELLSKKIKPKEILIIEKGNSSFKRECPATKSGCRHCKICDVVYGFGGAGMFSDGKLEVDRSQKFDKKSANRVFEHMSQFGLTLITKNEKNKVLNRLSQVREMLKPCGLSIQDDFVSQHIGTNGIIEITRKMEKYLIEQGVNILFKQEVHRVNRDQKTGMYNVFSTNCERDEFILTSKIVVVGIGKSAHHNFENIFDEIELEKEQKPPIIGVRYEFPVEAMMTISKGILKDPLIYWKTPQGDEITTYCTCHRGRVVPYFSGELLLLGGHALANDDREVTNFGLAFIVKSQKMAISNEFSYSFAKLINSVGGNKVVIQTFGDFLNNTLNDEHKLHRTTLKYYVYGNLNLLLPNAIALSIRDFIKKIALLDKRFQDKRNILSVPIIEFVSPKLRTNQYFESTHKNLFFSGETSGRTYGIVTSASSGIQIADAVADRLLYST